MRRLVPLPVLALALLPGLASAQVSLSRAVRIPVTHADPWAIKAMMEGSAIPSPEISTVILASGGRGLSGALTGAANLLMGGRLFVNPTDNSLWWVPGGEAKP